MKNINHNHCVFPSLPFEFLVLWKCTLITYKMDRVFLHACRDGDTDNVQRIISQVSSKSAHVGLLLAVRGGHDDIVTAQFSHVPLSRNFACKAVQYALGTGNLDLAAHLAGRRGKSPCRHSKLTNARTSSVAATYIDTHAVSPEMIHKYKNTKVFDSLLEHIKMDYFLDQVEVMEKRKRSGEKKPGEPEEDVEYQPEKKRRKMDEFELVSAPRMPPKRPMRVVLKIPPKRPIRVVLPPPPKPLVEPPKKHVPKPTQRTIPPVPVPVPRRIPRSPSMDIRYPDFNQYALGILNKILMFGKYEYEYESAYFIRTVLELARKQFNHVGGTQIVEIVHVESMQNNVVFLGDTHGNTEDLAYIIRRNLNFKALHMKDVGDNRGRNPVFVVIGDFVDRSTTSFESVLLICLMKVLFPRNMYAVMGNHEHMRMREKSIRKMLGEDKYKLLHGEMIIRLGRIYMEEEVRKMNIRGIHKYIYENMIEKRDDLDEEKKRLANFNLFIKRLDEESLVDKKYGFGHITVLDLIDDTKRFFASLPIVLIITIIYRGIRRNIMVAHGAPAFGLVERGRRSDKIVPYGASIGRIMAISKDFAASVNLRLTLGKYKKTQLRDAQEIKNFNIINALLWSDVGNPPLVEGVLFDSPRSRKTRIGTSEGIVNITEGGRRYHPRYKSITTKGLREYLDANGLAFLIRGHQQSLLSEPYGSETVITGYHIDTDTNNKLTTITLHSNKDHFREGIIAHTFMFRKRKRKRRRTAPEDLRYGAYVVIGIRGLTQNDFHKFFIEGEDAPERLTNIGEALYGNTETPRRSNVNTGHPLYQDVHSIRGNSYALIDFKTYRDYTEWSSVPDDPGDPDDPDYIDPDDPPKPGEVDYLEPPDRPGYMIGTKETFGLYSGLAYKRTISGERPMPSTLMLM